LDLETSVEKKLLRNTWLNLYSILFHLCNLLN